MDKAIYKELLSIAAERGIPVVETEKVFSSIKCEGFYMVHKERGTEIIFIKKSISSQVDKNFILAHEIGHCVLEHKKVKDKSIEEMEEQADIYAYRLLGQLIEEIGQCCYGASLN